MFCSFLISPKAVIIIRPSSHMIQSQILGSFFLSFLFFPLCFNSSFFLFSKIHVSSLCIETTSGSFSPSLSPLPFFFFFNNLNSFLETLKKHFLQYGDIKEAVVIRFPHSGTSRYAHFSFSPLLWPFLTILLFFFLADLGLSLTFKKTQLSQY